MNSCSVSFHAVIKRHLFKVNDLQQKLCNVHLALLLDVPVCYEEKIFTEKKSYSYRKSILSVPIFGTAILLWSFSQSLKHDWFNFFDPEGTSKHD